MSEASTSLIRLSPDLTENEIRIEWHDGDVDRGITAWGPRGASRLLMGAICEGRAVYDGTMSQNLQARLEGTLKDEPGALQQLEKAGYDPRTLVVSIRRRDEPAHVPVLEDTMTALVEEARGEIEMLRRELDSRPETAKEVLVMSWDDRDALLDRVATIENLLGRALGAPWEPRKTED